MIEEGTTAERADKLRHHAAWLLKMGNETVYDPVNCRCCTLESNAEVTHSILRWMSSEVIQRTLHARTMVVVQNVVASTFNIQRPCYLPRLKVFS